MKKKFILAVVLILTLFSSTAMAADTKLYFNGEKQDATVTVIKIDDAIMVPIRPIFELFQYKIEWDGMRQRIRTTTGLGKLVIQIGSVLVSQNNYQPYVLDTYPRIYEGTTLIPSTFAAAATDSSVQYIESTNSLVITAN